MKISNLENVYPAKIIKGTLKISAKNIIEKYYRKILDFSNIHFAKKCELRKKHITKYFVASLV